MGIVSPSITIACSSFGDSDMVALVVATSTDVSHDNRQPRSAPFSPEIGGAARFHRRRQARKATPSAADAGTSTSKRATRSVGTAGGAGVAPGVPVTTDSVVTGFEVLLTVLGVIARATGSTRMLRLCGSASTIAGRAQTRSIRGLLPSGVAKVRSCEAQRMTRKLLSSAPRPAKVGRYAKPRPGPTVIFSWPDTPTRVGTWSSPEIGELDAESDPS